MANHHYVPCSVDLNKARHVWNLLQISVDLHHVFRIQEVEPWQCIN
jgi:hypothetical protein